MRFSFAHKLSTYLMVASSYLALVLSGELGGFWVLAALVGIVVSWFWEPPRIRFERWSRLWTVLSVLVLAFSAFDILSGGDVLLVGAHFLLYLLVAKLCNRRACKDYQQVYILTFLMLVSGTVLNFEFTYGVFFLGYVVASTWALILFHLRREMEDNFLLKHSDDVSSERVQVARILNSRRIVGRRFFTGTALVSLTIFAGATLLFLLIPRIGFGLFFAKKRSGVTMAGFSDGVQLGGHGLIKDDRRVVMRVVVDGAYQGRRAPYLHWRGVAFDQYEGGEWQRSSNAPHTNREVTLPGPTLSRHHLLYDRPRTPGRVLDAQLPELLRQEVYLEPLGYDVLFGASIPMAFEFEIKSHLREEARKERNDEIRHPHTAGIRYVVYSDPRSPPAQVLREAPAELPDGFEVYLQLPPEITDDVVALAEEITAAAPTNYDKAVAIQRWLQDNLEYTLQMVSPGRTEPIHFFLFERKKGHCEYFSSAMAVMARAVGIPTRNVNGFLGGEWNEYNNYIAVRAGDAHSWVEVYFPGSGWVTFDPTPAAQVDRLGRGSGGITDRLRRLADSVRFKWFQWVIEYDLHRQLKLFRSVGDGLRGKAGGFVRQKLGAAREWARGHKKAATAIALSLAAAIGIVMAWRRRRRRDLEVLGSSGRRRSRDPIAAQYLRILTRLARRGFRRSPATTPREHARNLAASRAPGATSFSELTELYYAAEYGKERGADAAERARRLGEEIDREIRESKRAGAGRKGREQKSAPVTK